MTQDLLYHELTQRDLREMTYEALLLAHDKERDQQEALLQALHTDPLVRREAYRGAIALLEREDIELAREALVNFREHKVQGYCMYGACLSGAGFPVPDAIPTHEIYESNLFPELEAAVRANYEIPVDENGWEELIDDFGSKSPDVISYINDTAMRHDKAQAIKVLKLALARTYIEDES